MGCEIEQKRGSRLSGLGAWDANAVLQQLQNMPSSTDQIVKAAGLSANPFQPGSPGRVVTDKVLGEAKKVGLDVAKKIASGALDTAVGAGTSLSIGASIGSAIPIPGIGTAIGAIGSLIFEGFKALGKLIAKRIRERRARRKGFRPCPKYTCPEPPPQPATELLLWVAHTLMTVAKDRIRIGWVGEPGRKRNCDRDGVFDCFDELVDLMGDATSRNPEHRGLSGVVLDTVPYMGLPQVERLLPLYRAAPIVYPYFSENKGQVVQDPLGRSIGTIVLALERRQATLRQLVARIQALDFMRSPKNDLIKLRFDLGPELTKAAQQAQLAPGPETFSWFRTLGDASLQMQARDRADNEALRQHSAVIQQRAAEVAADPARARSLRITQLQFQCSEAQGRGAACDELRLLQGGAPVTGRPVPAVASQPQATLYRLAQARNKYVSDYLKRLNQQGNMAARMIMLGVSQQPNLTLANLPDKTYEYLDRQAKAGDKAAGMLLYAAVKEFQDKVRAA